MEIEAIRTEGLGDTSYVLSHEGVALVVDPQRDIDRFAEPISNTGATPRFVLETHVHNDYVSGGRALASEVGAELVFPAGAAPVFRHSPAFHQEDLDAGAFLIRPLHTPGHTPEHLSYVIVIGGQPTAVFSGGCLLVGAAGRSDLLGADRAESLARLQYGSVKRLAELPDETGLYPTHGAGSFCTASVAGVDSSTIGAERKANPVLAHPDEESFVGAHLYDLVPFPSYYARMAPINLQGPDAPEDYSAPRLEPDELNGETVVDLRSVTAHARAHVPGSISIPLRSDFGVWAGWVLPPGAEPVLMADPGQDTEEALRQLSRIGMDQVRGIVYWDDELAGDAHSHRVVDIAEFAEAVERGVQVLDARAPNEWDEGVIPGSVLAYAPDVAAETPDSLDPEREVWVACGTGYRASLAASFLRERGFDTVVLAGAGVPQVLAQMKAAGAKV